MRPGIYLVCDPCVRAARESVARMAYNAGLRSGSELPAGCGRDWAALAVPPAAETAGIGADIHVEGGDVLIWSGEIVPPVDAMSAFRSKGDARSDRSHALLQQLREQGTESLAEVDGSFCGAWYEARRHRWTIFNDRFGQFPVFWTASAELLTLAPHARLSWLGSNEPLQYDERGVTDLLRTGNMVDDHTLLEGVHWLKPGHVLYWGEEGCGSYAYWDLSRLLSRNAPLDKLNFALDTYRHALRDTLERHTNSDAEVALGISGGMDSRVYLATCDALHRTPSCFTMGFPFSEDVRYGRQAARAVDAQHDWIPLRPESSIPALESAIVDSDGLLTASHLSGASAVRDYLARHTGRVLLDGYYHGAQAGQYIPADEEVAWDDPPHSRSWARRFLHAGIDHHVLQTMLYPDLARDSYRRWKTQINDRYHRAPFEDRLQRSEYTIIAGRSGRIDVLGTALLRDHVHVRTPACEKSMLAWMVNTSPTLRRGKQLCIEYVRRHHPALARVQRANSGGMPIDDDRWLREKCWQRERVHRWYAAARYPTARRWGLQSDAMRAWTFHHWMRSGRLDILRDKDARILHWLRPESVNHHWEEAVRDPEEGRYLFGPATIEVALRSLDELSRQLPVAPDQLIRFRNLLPGTPARTDNRVMA